MSLYYLDIIHSGLTPNTSGATLRSQNICVVPKRIASLIRVANALIHEYWCHSLHKKTISVGSSGPHQFFRFCILLYKTAPITTLFASDYAEHVLGIHYISRWIQEKLYFSGNYTVIGVHLTPKDRYRVKIMCIIDINSYITISFTGSTTRAVAWNDRNLTLLQVEGLLYRLSEIDARGYFNKPACVNNPWDDRTYIRVVVYHGTALKKGNGNATHTY